MANVPVMFYLFGGPDPVGPKPTTTVSAAYTGGTITNGYVKPAGVNMTGDASGVYGGVYTAVYTPDEDHCWDDETRDPVTVTLTISYVWVKWNAIIASYSQASNYYVAGSGKIDDWTSIPSPFYSSWDDSRVFASWFDSATGLYHFADGTIRNKTETSRYGHWTATELYPVSQNVLMLSAPRYYMSDMVSTYMKYQLKTGWIGSSGSSDFGVSCPTDCGCTMYYTTPNYGKGSTNYGNVSSLNNPSAYPENGKQGDYWYVKTW